MNEREKYGFWIVRFNMGAKFGPVASESDFPFEIIQIDEVLKYKDI